MSGLTDSLAPLEDAVALLLEAADAYTEYDLLTALRDQATAGFTERAADTLALFRQHFLLFHLLYRLRDRWRAEGRADLIIDPLRIARVGYGPGEAAVAAADPLRSYYLDLQQLECTGAAEVEAMLAGFDRRLRAGEAREAAMAVLGIDGATDYAQAKAQYRRLAMRHHPDRGGDTARLQALNEAMAVLADWYGKA